MTTGPIARPNGELTLDCQQTSGLQWMRLQDAYDPITGVTLVGNLVWDTIGLDWVKMTQPGGGTGGGGAVTVADGADVTQGAKADAAWDGVAASPSIVAIDKAMWAKLEAVRALLVGTLTIGGTVNVSNFPASQAVTAAALPLPTGAATDATLAARLKPADTLAGVTTVGAVTAITNPLPAGTNTLGKVDQGVANATPWNDNLAQVGGTAIAAKALPTGGSGQTAVPVYHNAIQLLTYTFGARAIVTSALTANTAKAILSLEVAAGNTKTVKVRRILISGIQTTLLAGLLDIQLNRGNAASSAGTAVTAGVRVTGDAAPNTIVKTLPTIVAATVLDQLPFAVDASAAVSAQPQTVIYDWQEGGETKPWTLKPGVIDSLVLNAISTAAQNWTLTIHITLTEE